MTTVTLWGSVNADGSLASSSGGFTVAKSSTGTYVVTFAPAFSQTPAIVATQNRYGSGENPLDNVVANLVSTSSATLLTGDAAGNLTNRNFGFIAIGNLVSASRPLASFEVLAQPIAPGVPDVAYVQQGFFVQISNQGASSSTVSLGFASTPAFVAANGAIQLFANTIDQNGNITQYSSATFLTAPVGFKNIAIPAGATFLFGVQYLLLPSAGNPVILSSATGGTPQNTQSARGVFSLTASAGSNLLVLPTIRQVFTNYTPTSTSTSVTVLDVTEAAYSVPVVGGPQLQF